MPRLIENVIIGALMCALTFGLVLAGSVWWTRTGERAEALRQADRDRAALVSCKAAVDAVIIMASTAEPAADVRCFELPPMCRGQARPVCICGFYRSTCRWECSE